MLQAVELLHASVSSHTLSRHAHFAAMPFLSAYKDANDKFERSMKSPSGFAGVSFHNLTGKWQAALGGKYVGLYPTPEAAAVGRYEAKARSKIFEQAKSKTKLGPEAQALLKTNAVPETIAAAGEANIKRAKIMLNTIGDTAGVSPQLVIKYNRGSESRKRHMHIVRRWLRKSAFRHKSKFFLKMVDLSDAV